MSFDKVEVRVFSGPDQVQVGSNTEPDLIVMNIGPKGDTGPNSVTSVTTSDGTATLSIADLEVVGGEIYTDGEYSHIYTQGDGAEIFTIGTDAIIYTQGADAHISTSGDSATIYTSGASGSIYTTGANAGISTAGANATMGTQGANATISTTGSAAHIQTTHASAAVKSTNFAAVDSGGASLVDGSFQPCLTWSAGGRNLTIPSGTATTFNTTSYTFGTGAASAFVTALGTFNSSTATALQNSRNIFGIAFNGTANVAGDATNTGHFASIPTGGQAGHFVTLNGTAPTVIAGRSAWWSDGSGNPSFRNGTGTAVTLVKSSDLGTNVATFLATPTSANLASALTDENGTGGGFVRAEGATLTTPTFTGSAARANGQNAVPATSDEVMTRGQSDSRIGKVAVMSADVTVVSSTTPVPLTASSSNHPDGLSELGFTLAANKTYAFEFIGEFYEETSPKNQLFTLAGPSGSSFSSRIIAGASGSTAVYQIGGGSTVSNLISSGAFNGMIKIYGLIKMGGTSGNVTLRFSQNSSTANPTTIKKGSTMILFGGA